MNPFKKQSAWDRLTEPVSGAVSSGPVRSGLTAIGTAVGVTLASTAISAWRRRQEGR